MPTGAAMFVAPMTRQQNTIFIILILVLLTLAVYGQVNHFEFIHYDDNMYVTHNYQIQRGFTFRNMIEVLTDKKTTNWHPLTMMSHMLDWELFGENAGGHHWTNLIFHICNTILLFLLLNRMTGAVWRSGLVAALFAVHPINVESVAWVAERKNVLSTFFWFLTMLFYVWYVRKPGWKRYLPVFVCFALGLMSKPMLVTLPFVLLLMDYWPLNRTSLNIQNDRPVELLPLFTAEKVRLGSLIWEKIPLFVLTAVSVVLTIYAAKSNSTIVHLNMLPFSDRLENAILSYALYLKKLIWPADLAVFYPLLDIPLHQTLTAGILLIVITVVSCKYYKKHPYLTVGWLWYLGTLIPVIGIIQVGSQSMADRYAYVPFIGLFVGVVWLIADVVRGRFLQKIAVVFLVVLLLCLSYAAHRQVGYWQNTFMLFQRALQVTTKNFIAHVTIGNEFIRQNRLDEAIAQFHTSININPKNPANYFAWGSLGIALQKKDKSKEAMDAFQQALNVNPYCEEAYYWQGLILFQTGKIEEAITKYQKAIILNCDNPSYHISLGNAYLIQSRTENAIEEFREVLRIQPDNVLAHNNLGMILLRQGKSDEALQLFQQAVKIQPLLANAHYHLSLILKHKGMKEQASFHYHEAVRLNPEYAKIGN